MTETIIYVTVNKRSDALEEAAYSPSSVMLQGDGDSILLGDGGLLLIVESSPEQVPVMDVQ
jgi:hypothetical protein